jgi:hypothetical protein
VQDGGLIILRRPRASCLHGDLEGQAAASCSSFDSAVGKEDLKQWIGKKTLEVVLLVAGGGTAERIGLEAKRIWRGRAR